MDRADGGEVGRSEEGSAGESRAQRYLFYGGIGCLVIALVLAGFAILTGIDDTEVGPVPDTATTTSESADEAAETTSTSEPTTSTTPDETDVEETTTSIPGDASEDTGPTTTAVSGNAGQEEPPVPSIEVPSEGSEAERIAAVADQVDYTVLRLDLQDWELTSVDAGRDAREGVVVALIYERGDDFVNINHRSSGADQPLGEDGRPVQARGTTIQIHDMIGLRLARWEEGGASILASSTLSGEELVELLERLEPVA